MNIAYGSNQGLFKSDYTIKWERLSEAYAGDSLETNAHFAWSLAAGNYNGDSRDDLAVGSPGRNALGQTDSGAVTIFYGSGAGLYPVSYERLNQSHAGPAVESGDPFGEVLTSGNLNGDAYDELVIGVPHENAFGWTDNGIVMVLWGSGQGLYPTSAQWYGQSLIGGEENSHDRFGFAVASGDFDNDGEDDVAASAPWEDFPDVANNAGAVYVKEY